MLTQRISWAFCASVSIFLAAQAVRADTVTSTTAGVGWQSWVVGDVGASGKPYWNNGSFDSSHGFGLYGSNIGNFMTKTEDFSSNPNSPASAYSFWGKAFTSGSGTNVGAADPNFFWTRTGINQNATFEAEVTNFDGHHLNRQGAPIPANKFGWFVTDSTGSTVGAMTELFDSTSLDPVASNTFSPSAYFGFYLTSERGTFYTLSGHDSPWDDATFFQHFTTFQQDANTYWIGVEDLVTNPGGLEDKDYQDMVIKITSEPGGGHNPPPVPEPVTAMLGTLSLGALALAWGRRKIA